MRDIIADDETLQTGILPSLEEYNLDQFITADVPGCDHQVRLTAFLSINSRQNQVIQLIITQVIVSEAGRVKDAQEDGPRFLDPRSKTTFVFDHLRLVGFLCMSCARGMSRKSSAAVHRKPLIHSRMHRMRSLSRFGEHLRLVFHQNARLFALGFAQSLAMESVSTTYLANHFVDGVTTVLSTPESSDRFIIQIVANKYNPQNYW